MRSSQGIRDNYRGIEDHDKEKDLHSSTTTDKYNTYKRIIYAMSRQALPVVNRKRAQAAGLTSSSHGDSRGFRAGQVDLVRYSLQAAQVEAVAN